MAGSRQIATASTLSLKPTDAGGHCNRAVQGPRTSDASQAAYARPQFRQTAPRPRNAHPPAGDGFHRRS
jgi:hypothetical protein